MYVVRYLAFFRDVIVENDVNRSGGVAFDVCGDVFSDVIVENDVGRCGGSAVDVCSGVFSDVIVENDVNRSGGSAVDYLVMYLVMLKMM